MASPIKYTATHGPVAFLGDATLLHDPYREFVTIRLASELIGRSGLFKLPADGNCSDDQPRGGREDDGKTLRILDHGSGPASVTCALLQLHTAGKIKDVNSLHVTAHHTKEEFNSVTSAELNERIISNGWGKYCEAIEGSLSAIPARRDTFTQVFSCLSLMMSNDISASMKEMARVLKPGGQLLLASWGSLGWHAHEPSPASSPTLSSDSGVFDSSAGLTAGFPSNPLKIFPSAGMSDPKFIRNLLTSYSFEIDSLEYFPVPLQPWGTSEAREKFRRVSENLVAHAIRIMWNGDNDQIQEYLGDDDGTDIKELIKAQVLEAIASKGSFEGDLGAWITVARKPM